VLAAGVQSGNFWIHPRVFLLLPFHLRLGLSSDRFPSGLPSKIVYVILIPPMRTLRYMPLPQIIFLSP